MQPGGAERRRGRRVPIQATVAVRRPNEPVQREHATQNISLAGVYFETDHPIPLNDLVMTSVAIPESERRAFPFTRLAGRSRVVRVTELPPQDGRTRYGIALEFGNDLVALTASPPRG